MGWTYCLSKDEKQSDAFVTYMGIIELQDYNPFAMRCIYEFKAAPTKAKANAIADLFLTADALGELNVPGPLPLLPKNTDLGSALRNFDLLCDRLGKAKSDSDRVLAFDSISPHKPFSAMFDAFSKHAEGDAKEGWGRYTKFLTSKDLTPVKGLMSGKLVAPQSEQGNWKKRATVYETCRSALAKAGFDVASLKATVV